MRKKTVLEYKKSNKNNLVKAIWRYERDFIKLDELNKKKRKYFKYKKVNYIRRFCRIKESLSKEKKDTLTVFEKSKNENVLKRKKS